MGEEHAQDLASLDRDVARGWTALGRWRAAIAEDPNAYADEDPLEAVRRVAGKSTWDALGNLTPSAIDAPLRDALRRWVFALTQARIGRADDIAWERAAAEARGRFFGPRPSRVGWREAWRGAVAAKTVEEVALWLDAAADAAPALADLSRRRATRRLEVARRFGVEHPWAPLLPIDLGAVRDAARRLLDATEDLWRAVSKPTAAADAGMPAVIHAAVARDAGDGWPAQLTPRWLDDAFPCARRGLRVELRPLPPALGAASFARALRTFGFAVRIAAGASSARFTLTQEPAFIGAHRLAFVFGALASNTEWQVRSLGLGLRAAHAQSRLLARTALLDTRLHAARLLLGDDAAISLRERFDELGARLFAGGILPGLRGAWPRAREDEPARFLGLVASQAFAENLRERFDSDWYRNPRAWDDLRAMGSSPAHEGVDARALAVQVDRLARAFDEALG